MTRRFLTDQAQIIASCDFKPLNEEETLLAPSTNGMLFSLRGTLRALAQETVATNIQGFHAEGSRTGEVAGLGTISVYVYQLKELEAWFGEGLGEGAVNFYDDDRDLLGHDIHDLNEILRTMNSSVNLMNFAHATGEEAAMLEERYNTENNTVLAEGEPDDPYYIQPKLMDKNYPGAWEDYMNYTLGFSEGVGEFFSSTKVFLQILQGVGFSAGRYFPNLCLEAEKENRKNDEGAPFCIRPNPDLDFDFLGELSYKTNGSTPLPKLFDTTIDNATVWISRAKGQIRFDTGELQTQEFFENEPHLKRLFMLLSREFSNSAALKYYESDDAGAVEMRNRLGPDQGGGLDIMSHPGGSDTYAKNATNLVNNHGGVNWSPFGGDPAPGWTPGEVSPGEVLRNSDVRTPPAPTSFVTLDVFETTFPGGGPNDTVCSLFEPGTLNVDAGDIVVRGTRDFLIGAFFDKDEIVSFRDEGFTLSEKPEYSRLTTIEKEFAISMKAYRDYIIDMTALKAVDKEATTTPRAILKRLFCSTKLVSLMGDMTTEAGYTVAGFTTTIDDDDDNSASVGRIQDLVSDGS